MEDRRVRNDVARAIARRFNDEMPAFAANPEPMRQGFLRVPILDARGVIYAWEVLVHHGQPTTIDILLRIGVGDAAGNAAFAGEVMAALGRTAGGVPPGLAVAAWREQRDIRFRMTGCRRLPPARLLDEAAGRMRALIAATLPIVRARLAPAEPAPPGSAAAATRPPCRS